MRQSIEEKQYVQHWVTNLNRNLFNRADPLLFYFFLILNFIFENHHQALTEMFKVMYTIEPPVIRFIIERTRTKQRTKQHRSRIQKVCSAIIRSIITGMFYQ